MRNVDNRIEIALLVLIALNVAAVIVDSMPDLSPEIRSGLDAFEFASVAVFSIEYVVRLVLATREPGYEQPVVGRIRYALRPMMLLDLVVLLPVWLPFLFSVDLRTLRILRMFRIFRVLKLGRYSNSMHVLGTAIHARRGELGVAVFTVAMMLLLASSLMYFVENDAQPDKFSSIPAAMWWAIATFTTVGYGDVTPITGLGRFLGGLCAMLGIGLFALPAGILASAFSEAMQKKDAAAIAAKGVGACPHCGRAP
jgi:voltage-gated potassium channel